MILDDWRNEMSDVARQFGDVVGKKVTWHKATTMEDGHIPIRNGKGNIILTIFGRKPIEGDEDNRDGMTCIARGNDGVFFEFDLFREQCLE